MLQFRRFIFFNIWDVLLNESQKALGVKIKFDTFYQQVYLKCSTLYPFTEKEQFSKMTI